MTEQVDLDALEALATAATPGPWESWNVYDETIEVRAGTALEGGGSHRTTDMIVEYDVYGFDLDEPDFVQREADADFIAAADPSTVLALIAELRQERERAEMWRVRCAEETTAWADEAQEKRDLEAALSRAEETIENAKAMFSEDAPINESSWVPDETYRILTEYDKQKGAAS